MAFPPSRNTNQELQVQDGHGARNAVIIEIKQFNVMLAKFSDNPMKETRAFFSDFFA